MERYQLLKSLFLKARRRGAAERTAMLNSRSANSPSIRAELQGLLTADAQTSGFGTGMAAAVEAVEPIEQTSLLAELPVPARIGRYEIQSILGHGAMGIVYRAQQPNPRRPVALKVLSPAWSSRQDLHDLVQNEALALARLMHPGIAAIFEAGETPDGICYLAMELACGVPLDRFLESRRVSRQETLEVFVRISEAVAYAHSRGVIHRDLKPANILVDDEGRPKILDFGIAKLLTSERAAATTHAGVVKGTIAYMSPEQITGGPTGPPSDVYALGVILWEMLTGDLPFDLSGVTLPRAARIICQEPIVRPSKRDPTLRGDLELILLKALEKRPEARYANAGALSDDIQQHLNGASVRVRPARLPVRVLGGLRRHRFSSVGVAAALTVAVVAGFETGSVPEHAASPAPGNRSEPTLILDPDPHVSSSLERGIRRFGLSSDLQTAEQEVRAGMERDSGMRRRLRDLLGDILHAQGRYREAETEYRQALAERQHQVAQVLVNARLAATLAAQGRAREAEALFKTSCQAADGAALAPGLKAKMVVSAAAGYGQFLCDARRYQEAEDLLLEAHRGQRGLLSPGDPDLRQLLAAIVQVYTAADRPEKAAEYRAILAEQEEALGPEVPGAGMKNNDF